MTWQLLSQASSWTPDRERWFEVTISRRVMGSVTDYQVVMIGHSTVFGESKRERVETTTSPHAVVDFLSMGEPNNRYVPKVSRKAIHEAGDIDQFLADALDDFDSVVRR